MHAHADLEPHARRARRLPFTAPQRRTRMPNSTGKLVGGKRGARGPRRAVLNCFYVGTSGAATISGGDRHALEVWSAWLAQGRCDVRVFASYWGRGIVGAFGYPVETVVIEQEPSAVGNTRLGYAKRCLRALRLVPRAPRGDVVYAASTYFYDLLPAIVLGARDRATLIVALFHFIPPPWKRRGGSVLVNFAAWVEQRLMLRLVRRFADCVVVDNTDVADALSRFGVDHVVVSSMGVRSFEGSDGCTDAKVFSAVYVGRLTGTKGVPLLIGAWRLVVNTMPQARLALVGESEPGFDPRGVVHEAGLDNSVSVLSGLSDEAVRRVLGRSEIFITASTEEGYGLSVLEALAARLPCVTFDVPAFREAFPYGRAVAEERTAECLARTALRLLANPALRAALRDNITANVEVKSWGQVASELWDTVAPLIA